PRWPAVCGDVTHAPVAPGVLGRSHDPTHVDRPDLGLSRPDQSDIESKYRLALVHRLPGGLWHDRWFCDCPFRTDRDDADLADGGSCWSRDAGYGSRTG